jgi:FkbM family methyltransferase
MHPYASTSTRYGTVLYPKNDSLIGRSLELYGEWAQHEINFMKRYIQPGDFCVDMGAYIGTHTLFFANQVGPVGKVFAFEMQRIMVQLLCANASNNRYLNVFPYHAVVSDRAGTTSVPAVNLGKQASYGSVSLKKKFDFYLDTSTVSMLTLDSLDLPKVNFLKMGLESYELEALRGASDTIRKYKPLIYLEYHSDRHTNDVLATLADWGYNLYLHEIPLFNKANFKRESKDVFSGYGKRNIFCVHKSRKETVHLDRIA